MSTKEELHVIFGAGPVGLSIMEELLRQGKRVRLINRSGRAAAPDGVEIVAGDATDLDFARKAAAGATHIYNALNPAYHLWLDLFPALQAGTIAAAEATGARLIVMENLYMYGHTRGKPMTEDMPYDAHTRKGELRAEMHRTLLAAHEAGRIRFVSGRASDFYGPGVLQSGMGERVFYPALAGKAASVVGDPDQPHTYTYVPDIGRALVTLGQHDDAFGRAWHIPAAQTLTTRQFIEKVYAATGNPAKVSAAPKFILRAFGLINKDVREVVEMVYEFEEPFVVDHSDYAAAFGDHSTPLAEAIQATVDWYRAHPKQ